MTDARLRELERRWRESGALADQAAYLLERARVGELDGARLHLAAMCGCEAARLALGRGAPPAPASLRELVRALATATARARTLRLVVVLGDILAGAGAHEPHVRRAQALTRRARAGVDEDLVDVHVAWQDVCGVQVLFAGTPTHLDVLRLVLDEVLRRGRNAEGLAKVRTSLSAWAIDGVEP